MASRKPGVKEISVNLPPSDFQLVETLSRSLDLSRSEVVRRLVAQGHRTLLAAKAIEDRDRTGCRGRWSPPVEAQPSS